MTAGAARIAIVTVSDRASRGEYEDKGGPGAEAWLRGVITSPMTIDRHIIPDGRDTVAAAPRRWKTPPWPRPTMSISAP